MGDLQLPKFGDIASQFDGKPATYESKAQNLSQWIEESTAMLEDKDYLNASHREIEDLQRDLVHFRQVEKPPKYFYFFLQINFITFIKINNIS